MIDDPVGQNAGLYRVGNALNTDGVVTGGWSPWITIPDWFSFENQYGAITLADLDGDENLELIVLMIDSPGGVNRALYRVGPHLDSNGNVLGTWSPWTPIDSWFSWVTQGVGLTVADLKGTGSSDLIVFQIDRAYEQNQAFYTVVSGLKIDSALTGAWSPWWSVPS